MKQKPRSGASRQSNKRSRDRIARLFLLVDEKLEFIEQRHANERELLSSTENEKDARTMMSLMRVYEKLVEMKERLDSKAQSANDRDQGPEYDEAERLCQDLADRIERLQKQTARSDQPD